jgi:hypothetical protein
MAMRVCPWLGSEVGQEALRAEPHPTLRCYARQAAVSIDLAYQAQFCLTSEYRICSYYREASAQVEDPAAWAGGSEPELVDAVRTKGGRLRLALWAVAGLVLALAALYYSTALRPSAPVGGPATAEASSTPTIAPTATPAGPAASGVEPTSTSRFQEPTATPTPVPGGAIYRLAARAGEGRLGGQRRGAGQPPGRLVPVRGAFRGGGVPRHLSTRPGAGAARGADRGRGAGVDGPGRRRLGATGRVGGAAAGAGGGRELEPDDLPGCAQRSGGLDPGAAAGGRGAGGGRTNVLELPRALLDELEGRLLDQHYTLSFRWMGRWWARTACLPGTRARGRRRWGRRRGCC